MDCKRFVGVALGSILALSGIARGADVVQPESSPRTAEIDSIERERAMVSARELSAAFRHAARAIESSVVHIITEQPTRRGFRAQTGVGSGVILDARGYILTNFHVVQQGRMITVRLSDGRTAQAEMVGGFEETDLAVLKIDLPGLRPASFGDSEAIGVGEWVLAVGSPFGFEQTVTAGIISAKGRGQIDPQASNDGPTRFQEFLQTDAAINPGNSGGALVDSAGHLVGINTAIYSRSGGSLGIGFAIPVSIARNVLTQIVSTGEVIRGWVGVEIQDLTPELAESFGFADARGTLIAGVLRGSPAERAGIRPGDVLIELDGAAVRDPKTMLDMVAALPPGREATFRIRRGGQEIELGVEIGRRPTPQPSR